MTLKQCADIVEARIRDTSSTTDTRVREIANDVADAILLHVGFKGQEKSGIIRSVDGQATYALSPDVARVLDTMYTMEDQQPIVPSHVDTWDYLRPKPTASGTPTEYVLWGEGPITQQPHSKLRLVSDSASDTQDVVIYGISYGIPRSETITLTGMAAVLSTYAYQQLTDAPTAASAAVGTITATSNSTSGDTARPTVANAGNVTVFTITADNTQPTDQTQPGSLLRFEMNTDTSGDRSQSITIEGYIADRTNLVDRIFTRETVTTDATNSTTSVVSSNVWTEVTNITKNWNSTHRLLVMCDPGDKVVTVIPPEHRSVKYPYIQFHPIPSGEAIRYRYMARWSRLFNNTDQPSFDERFDSIWVDHTWRYAAAYKRNEAFNITADPVLKQDVLLVLHAQHTRDAPMISLGSGIRKSDQRLTLGRLDPSRYRNY